MFKIVKESFICLIKTNPINYWKWVPKLGAKKLLRNFSIDVNV